MNAQQLADKFVATVIQAALAVIADDPHIDSADAVAASIEIGKAMSVGYGLPFPNITAEMLQTFTDIVEYRRNVTTH